MRSISFLIQGAESALLSAFASPQRTPQAGAQTANQSVTGAFSNLNLTAQEQTAIHSLVQSASTGSLSFAQLTSKIDGVLSPEQQQTFKTDLQALAAA
ncbi:MAG: hypothetical protein JO199_03350, partial [Candidatus Eremiobacteraeota bacterium]|nr:hypothetical protein [Candidatus Eremiobacteraeota bacterium]